MGGHRGELCPRKDMLNDRAEAVFKEKGVKGLPAAVAILGMDDALKLFTRTFPGVSAHAALYPPPPRPRYARAGSNLAR